VFVDGGFKDFFAIRKVLGASGLVFYVFFVCEVNQL
jgi:hypothetical protein